MKIQLKGETYTVTEEAIQHVRGILQTFVTGQYMKLPETGKLVLQAGVRGLLQFAEKAESDPDKKRAIRPMRGSDPALHLVSLLLDYIAGALPNVQLQVTTDENNTINNLTIQSTGEGRGPLSTHGDIGERQDNSGKAS